MVSTLYFSILIILLLSFGLERWLDYLNSTSRSSSLPDELIGIYDDTRYLKAMEYERTKSRFNLFTGSISFIVTLSIFLSGGFGSLDQLVRSWVSNPIVITLLYFGLLAIAAGIGSLPFKWYDTFYIEEKFGFNRSTPAIFIVDQIKEFFLGALLGGLILSLIVWIYLLAGNLFWLYALMVIATFSVFMLIFYSSIIVPLFNKQTPLPEGELKEAITGFSLKAGFSLDNIFVIDGSKRSTKANAYFTGLGRKKRIVLYDTLIKDLTTNEIVAVLAHEIGHYKKHHVYSGLLISLTSTAIMLYVFSLVSSYPDFALVLGSDHPGFHLAVISFGILYTPLSIITGLVQNYLSRLNEFEADRFATINYDGEALISALKKLSVNNLSNLTPHPLFVFFHYSHPTLLNRIKAIRNEHVA